MSTVFGLYDIPDGSSDEFLSSAVQHGITVFGIGDWRKATYWLGRINSAGGKGVLRFGWSAADPALLKEILETVDAVKDHPALAGYETFDEPNLDYWYTVGDINYKKFLVCTMRNLYNQVRLSDTNVAEHPMRLNLAANGIPIAKSRPEFVDMCDWMGFDDYPILNANWQPDQHYETICRGVKGFSGQKPLFAILQAQEFSRTFGDPNGPDQFRPTIDQMCTMAKICISESAREIWWFNAHKYPAELHGHIFEATRILAGIAQKTRHLGSFPVEASYGAWKLFNDLKPNTIYKVRPDPSSVYTLDSAPTNSGFRGVGGPTVNPSDWGIPNSIGMQPKGALLAMVRHHTAPYKDIELVSFANVASGEFIFETLRGTASHPPRLEFFIIDDKASASNNGGYCSVDIYEVV